MTGLEFDLEFIHWLVLGLLLMAVELLFFSTYFLWMGLAALVVGALLWLIPDMSFSAQVILFAVLSVSAIVLGQRYLKRHPIESTNPMLNMRGAQNIGRIATLHEPIINGVGKVHLDDTLWKILGPNLPLNARVRIVGVEGISLVVEPLVADAINPSENHGHDADGDGGGGD